MSRTETEQQMPLALRPLNLGLARWQHLLSRFLCITLTLITPITYWNNRQYGGSTKNRHISSAHAHRCFPTPSSNLFSC